VDAAVISQDDVNRDEDVIAAMAEAARVLVVTDGPAETRVYFEGQTHSIQPMAIEEVDPTGAGDIFAAAFFTSYQRSGDPLKAAQFASRIAAPSVTRIGLDSVPTQDEVFGLLADLAAQS
jgi:sugar/nucleoside kinase (ribokinase family)